MTHQPRPAEAVTPAEQKKQIPNWFCACCGNEGFTFRWPEFAEATDGNGQEVFLLKTCDQHEAIHD